MSEQERIGVIQYHERTKHRFDRFAKGPETIDWDAQPDPFRRYRGAKLTPLPLAADTLTLPFSALFEATAITPQALALPAVGLLLEISLALSAWKQYGSARWSLRCNPSSGNLHPTEAYLIVSGIDGLEDGVYHYRADEHALELRCRFTPSPGEPPALLLGLSSVHWREAWKYGERAYRYCQLDSGHAAAAVDYAAATLGWTVTPHHGIGDTSLARLLGVERSGDFTGAEPEHPDLLLGIQPRDVAPVNPETFVQRMEQGSWEGQANVLDPRHFYDWPVIGQVAERCRRPAQSTTDIAGFDDLPSPIPTDCSEAAAKLFRRRRSAQAFDGSSAMGMADFYRLLDHLLPRPAQAPWGCLSWPARIHPVLFVHRIEGLPAGLYALPRRCEAQTLLREQMRNEFLWQKVESAPEHLPLSLLIAAKADRTATTLSCKQAIAGDSAFSLAMLAEFGENIDETPWRYRELFWEAGTLGQALYLEAEASGLRGTGIGCFFDDGVHELLGIQGKTLQSLYHFTVGGAISDQRIVSLPPYNRDK